MFIMNSEQVMPNKTRSLILLKSRHGKIKALGKWRSSLLATNSDYKLAYCGMVYAVPQGSVLGPSFDINDR